MSQYIYVCVCVCVYVYVYVYVYMYMYMYVYVNVYVYICRVEVTRSVIYVLGFWHMGLLLQGEYNIRIILSKRSLCPFLYYFL